MGVRLKTAAFLVAVLVFLLGDMGCYRPAPPVRLNPPAWIQGTWASELGGQRIQFTEQDLIFQAGPQTYRATSAFSSVSEETGADNYTVRGIPAFPLSLVRSGEVRFTFRRIDPNVIEVENPYGASGRFIRQTATQSWSAAEIQSGSLMGIPAK